MAKYKMHRWWFNISRNIKKFKKSVDNIVERCYYNLALSNAEKSIIKKIEKSLKKFKKCIDFYKIKC